MLQSLKRVLWVLLFAATTQCSFGFSLLGTYEPFQTTDIGYDLPGIDFNSGSGYGAPKNLQGEFRWTAPVIYYAVDQSFEGFFGTKGVDAIEQAVAVMNGLTNLSSYSADLSEFPQNPLRVNFRAQALTLLDLKTFALHYMLENLGLADSDRFVWTLRGRRPTPGGPGCPFMDYTVTIRSYDPITEVYSPYVNGTLFSYRIVDSCQPTIPVAVARTFPVDPRAPRGTSLASIRGLIGDGVFFTGLSRDDVAGLRYIYKPTNRNVETVSSETLRIETNFFSQLLVTSNLATFAAQSITNNAVALSNLYPGLIITGTTNFFTNVVTTNFTPYFTNAGAFSPVTPATLVLATNYFTNTEVRYIHSFANLVTNNFYTKGWVSSAETKVTGGDPFSSPGSLHTNTSFTTALRNFVNGDFYIIPSNYCGIHITDIVLTNLIRVTNTIPALTNLPGVSNVFGQNFSRDVITYFTNYSLIYYPILCTTNSIGYREGVDRLRFIRTTLDPISGRYLTPITNFYTLTAVNTTNSQRTTQTFQRIVTGPDWTFRAEDTSTGPTDLGTEIGFRTVPRFTVTTATNATELPGTLEGPANFDFNTVGPIIFHQFDTNAFLNGLSQRDGSTNFVWGSFDGTTNAPTVYPDGTSIHDLENQIYFSVTTTTLPDGQIGIPYIGQLLVSGGDGPYSWTLNATSAGLPDGLSLSPDGIISGTPTTDGIYDFTVDVTESGGRTISADLVITITP